MKNNYYLKIALLFLAAVLTTSCATLFKSGSQSVYVGPVPKNGIVLETFGEKRFVFRNSKKVTTTGEGDLLANLIAGGNTGDSEIQNVTEERKTDTMWIPPKNNSFDMSLSSMGKDVELKFYCNCSLKDKGKRLHTGAGGSGDAYLEPDCSGRRDPVPKNVSVSSNVDTLYVVLNIPFLGLGHLVDYLSGGLYEYERLNARSLCAGSTGGKKNRRRK